MNRRPIGDRWDDANAEQIQFVPWKVKEDDEKADGELMVAAKLSEEEVRDQLKESEFDLRGRSDAQKIQDYESGLAEAWIFCEMRWLQGCLGGKAKSEP